MPNVTVIIPTLNRPAELTRAVLSAINQTYDDLEVVVVADEPNEATLRALKSLENPRLRFLTNPSRVGLADARNIGVKNSSSSWVAFLDDDDEWMPDKIEKQLAVAETLPGEFIFVVSRYIERSGTGDRIWPEQLPAGKQRFSEYMYCRRGMLIPSTFFVSRSLITALPFTSGLRYLEDIDWMLRVTSDGRTQLGTVESPLVIYNNFSTPGQLSYDISWQRYYSWAVGHRQYFTPIAFSLFLTKTVVAKAREGNASWRELLHLFSATMLLGSFSPRVFFYFLASSLSSLDSALERMVSCRGTGCKNVQGNARRYLSALRTRRIAHTIHRHSGEWNKQMHMIDEPTDWVLPRDSVARRDPSRPVQFRQENYLREFDFHTVFCSCFRLGNQSRVVLIAPPLDTFRAVLPSMTLTGLPSGQKCSYSVRHRLRQCEIFAEVLTTDSDLQVNCEAGQKTIHLRTSQPELFRGKKVLLTLSKDNEVVWITDWMRFHRDAQGADALLLYDNASEKYSLNQLMEEMLQVGGFETIVIVKWPAPYGPQSFKGKYWDSIFCQDGVFEDARWRYLSEAHSVLNCDVDELVVSRNGSIFDLAASADTGYLSFNGRWALSVSDGGVSLGNPGVSLRHRDITYQLLPNWRLARFRLSDATLCPPKWVVVPKRCPEEAQ